jgi:hypothetical protein
MAMITKTLQATKSFIDVVAVLFVVPVATLACIVLNVPQYVRN